MKEVREISDFTTIRLQFNSNTDASPTWTGNNISFGGSAGANQIRWCAASAGGASTTSANWPLYTRPGSTTAVAECWCFATDGSGVKVATYDGGRTNSNVFRIDYDNVGTYAAAPSLTAYSDSTNTAASPGTQPGAQSGSPIINGSTDTSNTSYLKGNMYGTAQTSNLTAGAAGTTLAVTSGTAGSVSPSAAAFLATWQSLQAATQYITFPSTPAATTAGDIFFSLALWTGPTMSTSSSMQPVVCWQYAYS